MMPVSNVVPDRRHRVPLAELDRRLAGRLLGPCAPHNAHLAFDAVSHVRVEHGPAVVQAVHPAALHRQDEVVFLASAPVEPGDLGAGVPDRIDGPVVVVGRGRSEGHRHGKAFHLYPRIDGVAAATTSAAAARSASGAAASWCSVISSGMKRLLGCGAYDR